MKNLFTILISLLIISCGEEELESDFFYNTERIYEGNICNNRTDEWTKTYRLDSSRVIYACNMSFNTKLIITNNNLKDVYEELEYPEVKINPWILTYNNKNIIGIKESLGNKENKEIVSIDLATKEMKTLSVLPYCTYWFSKHPISENGILIFESNHDNKAIVFDTNTRKLNKSIYISNFPIISKDGKRTLLMDEEDVYLYDIKALFDTKITKGYFVYSSRDEAGFDVVHAYFGRGNEIIVSGVKNPNFKPLQKAVQRVIKDQTVVKKGLIDFNDGYRYY